MSLGNRILTFRGHMIFSSSSAEMSKKNLSYTFDCLDTVGSDHPLTQHHIPEGKYSAIPLQRLDN